MNWKEINEKCPKAFLEWAKKELTLSGDATSTKFDSIVDTNESEYWFRDNTDYYFIVDTDEARILPYYFDQYNIQIDTWSFHVVGIQKYAVAVTSNQERYFLEDNNLWVPYDVNKLIVKHTHFPNRLSATAAGAEKAFEIREQQLNELK